MKVRLPVAVSRWEKNLLVLLDDLNFHQDNALQGRASAWCHFWCCVAFFNDSCLQIGVGGTPKEDTGWMVNEVIEFDKEMFTSSIDNAVRPQPPSFVHSWIISDCLWMVPNSNVSSFGSERTVRLKEKYTFRSMIHGWDVWVPRHFQIWMELDHVGESNVQRKLKK